MPTVHTDDSLATPATASPTRMASGRRRLWQLTPSARDMLLMVAFEATWLRREASRVIGCMRHAPCCLVGTEGDVLGAISHDLGTRNPLSEALQRSLDQRYAVVVRALHRERSEETLRECWSAALVSDEPVPTLWALLTHPMGSSLEARLLWDVHAWCARGSVRAATAVAAHRQAQSRAQALEAEVAALRDRLIRQHRDADAERNLRDARLAELAGQLARTSKTPMRDAFAPPPPEPAKRALPGERASSIRLRQLRGCTESPATVRAEDDERTHAGQPKAEAGGDGGQSAVSQPVGPRAVQGRRVLCVGGMQHAVARYRDHVERLGCRFEHHDGGIEDALPRLDGRLARAEIVLCQAGCINHEAYHRVKRHCVRTGTPCVFLERPSLTRFTAALCGTAVAAITDAAAREPVPARAAASSAA